MSCLWSCSIARQCVSAPDRQKERQAGREREEEKPLHCTQESTCSALWECLDISSNGSARGKKGKVISMLWLQPAGAKRLAPVWHKQTHTVHTHTEYEQAPTVLIHTDMQTVIALSVFVCTERRFYSKRFSSVQPSNRVFLDMCAHSLLQFTALIIDGLLATLQDALGGDWLACLRCLSAYVHIPGSGY